MVSPQRLLAREASCSQFDAKLESPGRMNAKGRRERRVQSLLPDIARRRKAELEIISTNTGMNISASDGIMFAGERSQSMKMEVDMRNPFESEAENRVRQNSLVKGRESSILSRDREGNIVSKIRESNVLGNPRDQCISRSRDASRQGSILHTTREQSISRDHSLPPSSASISTPVSSTETQTRQAIKQTVIAALRLHSIPPSNLDYKLLVSHTVTAAIFALREKLQGGGIVGMGEIGAVVEGLLEVFLR